MDLQQATLTMALLMNKEYDFYQKHFGEEARCTLDPRAIRKPLTTELMREWDYLQANTREFGNQLAALPDFFEVLETQQVVVMGKEGVSVESLNMAIENQDADDLIARAGSLAQSVKDYLVSKGHPLANVSVGENGWDVSALCTERRSRELCEELLEKYERAIEFKLLRVSRRFAGHYIPGLYNYQDAVQILAAFGDDLPEL